ncbi:MAG TPA: S8 family serine peptidase [Thermoanaerobaculia bacterium]|jgi:subtilisin family serine protease|nr:S8 family serine peptidase [Thermoanaerobaculia bacterium]
MSFARCTRRLALALLLLITFAATPLLADRTYIVELTGEPAAVTAARAAAAGHPMTPDAIQQLRDDLRNQQEIMLARLRNGGVGFIVQTAQVPGFGNGAATTPVEYRYTLVYNGIALQLSDAAKAQVAATPGVKAVHENPVRRPLLDNAVAYLRAPAVYGPTAELEPGDDANDGFEGRGVNIAVIDTGIEWSHECFGGDPTPPRHGLLPPTAAVGSNQKVVYYLPLMENVVDDFGHGTHVAADAAGYLGRAPGADGVPGTADDVPVHGVAPQAKLMGYKVCSGIGSATSTVGCLGTSIILAIEDAVSPRTLTGFAKPVADVINLSLGSAGGPDDSDSVAASNAALLGTIVVAAAGNDGPGLRTLGSPAAGRHVIAVAATNDPGVYANPLEVLNALGQPQGARLAAIWAPDSNLKSNITAPISGRFVYAGYADTADQVPVTMLGNICLVERGSTVEAGDQGTGLFTVKVLNCEAKGAIATVVFNNEPGPLEGVLAPGSKPVFTLSQEDGRYLRDTIGFDAAGLSRQAIRISPPDPSMFLPQMAGFSSRGPVKGLGQVKPDVAAPGIDILSATTPVGVPVLSMASPTRYTSANGTSFSSPLVAGVAALLRQAHPTWSVDMVRTALINYATNLRTAAGDPIHKPNPIVAQGGGLVDVAAAVNAPALMGVVGDGVDEPALLGSHSFGRLPVVNTRTGHDERVTARLFDTSGAGGSYTFSVVDNRGLELPGVSVAVQPSRVDVPAGGDVDFDVTVTVDGDQLRTMPDEDLQWYVVATGADGTSLRMPFYLQPAPSQPAAAVGEETTAYEGIVLAGDTGAQLVGDVTYTDVPFTVRADTYALDATLDVSIPSVEGTYPDLDLILFDANGDELASSLSSGVPEHLEALTLGPGTYTYRAVGWLNGPTPFTITSKQLLGGQPPVLQPIAGEWTSASGAQIDFDGSFTLSWQPAGGETSFEIERSLDGGNWQTVASAAAGATSSTLSGQPAGTLAFRVRSLSPGRIGSFVSAPSATQTIVVDPRVEEIITSSVATAMAGTSFSGGVYSLDLKLTNQSLISYVPRVKLDIVRVQSTSGNVRTINADNGGNGLSTATFARYEYGNQLGADEQWTPAETTGARTLRFQDTLGEMFTFDVAVTANRRTAVANGTPDGPAGGSGATGSGSAPSGSTSLLSFRVNPLTGSVIVTRVTRVL